MRYGVPYKGNKSKIVAQILECIPSADHFYDLFAGGCAITHAALLDGRWDTVHANDLDGRGIRCFVSAVNGEYSGESRWISREDFMRLKDTDPYVAICWSFGNNMRDYLYSRELEPFKKALHEMIFAETTHDRRLKWRQVVQEGRVLLHAGGQYSIDTLSRLQNFESLERLEYTFLDYKYVPIEPNSVIYCDIPYYQRNSYGMQFDQVEFIEWAVTQTSPVFVSSYEINDARFKEVLAVRRVSTYSATNNAKKETERLYRVGNII